MGFEFTREGSFTDFLGIKFEKSEVNNTVTLTQKGLIQKIIAATGMEDCNPNCVTTPIESDTLARRSENWNVRSTSAREQPNHRQRSKQMNHDDRSIQVHRVDLCLHGLEWEYGTVTPATLLDRVATVAQLHGQNGHYDRDSYSDTGTIACAHTSVQRIFTYVLDTQTNHDSRLDSNTST
jgi:hypothetical protein